MNPENPNQNEQRIDTVLAALRDAEASEMLQQRLHTALREAAEAKPRPYAWRFLPSTRMVALAVAVTLVFTVTTGVIVHKRAPRQAANRAESATAKPPVASHNEHEPSISIVAHNAEVPVPTRHRQAAVTAAKNVAHQASAVDKEEQSFPAPPLPLTRQETLLLRVAHRNDPVQLAMLLPSVREDDFQRGKEQVKEFFKAPDPPAADPSESNANSNGVAK